MAKTFQVSIYSSDQTLYEGEAISLIAPSVSGYLGVLANHAPIVAKLVAGKITLRLSTGKTSVIDVSAGGFIEVLENKVTLLL
ncbi:MAG: F0F1 ATP synthase subunit epsilon [Candidatus Omnitrophica bacterium]|nr:F0F1 ATP synthase subunit epsilon [Candidatus Omnitrophota bacterium]